MKKIRGFIKLVIPAGKANPAPPIGPALGQRGLNIMEFCKAFNAQTQSIQGGTPMRVQITAYEDKTFQFVVKSPPVTHYIKQYSGVAKGSKATRKEAAVGKISMSQCREIAKIKMEDMNAYDLDNAALCIRGSAESMGLEIIED